MRRLTVFSTAAWPTNDAAMVAVSPQKLTCDRTCTVLDVWKVGAALELFGTSWAVELGEMRVARSGVVLACGVSRRDFETGKPNLHNTLTTCSPITGTSWKKRF